MMGFPIMKMSVVIKHVLNDVVKILNERLKEEEEADGIQAERIVCRILVSVFI